MFLRMLQNPLDLCGLQLEAVPEVGDLFISQAAAFNLPFDLAPRHERRLLFSLGVHQSGIRERPGDELPHPGPLPGGSERGEFLPDGCRTHLPAPSPRFPLAAIDVLLQRSDVENRWIEADAADPLDVREMDPRGRRGFRFDFTIDDGGAIAVQERSQRAE